MPAIKVHVAFYGVGRNLMMRYRNPTSGKQVARSTGTTKKREAERRAAVWEDELNSGRYAAPSRVTWEEFRQRYEREKASSLAPSTQVSIAVALNHLERTVGPDRLVKVTPAILSQFQAKLREAGMKETTIAHHLRHVKASLRWAERQGMLAKAPAVEMPKLPKGQALMRGRPVTAEEYERMLLMVPVVRPHDPAPWTRLITGLWFSGLRLGEALTLSWEWEAPFSVDFTGKRPVFRILAEAQKGRRDELLPMTPDFAAWLLRTPEADRAGLVFKLPGKDGRQMTTHAAGQIIVRVGRKAKVVVNKAEGKYASAHDLRRSFATRWASKVKPATLQLLMRHSNITTTLAYYVAQDANEVADELWEGWGGNSCNNLGNSARPATKKDSPPNATSLYGDCVSESGQGRD